MKKFSDYLNESKKKTIRLFHGDNHNTTKIDPKLMMQKNSNNQEGVGIYFGTLETARHYGKNIVYIDVEKNSFFNSRDLIEDCKELSKKLIKILLELKKIDNEEMYYFVTDWGIECDEKNINETVLKEVAEYLQTEEIRNFQIDMAEKFGVVNFVRVWNKVLPHNNGLFCKETNFYAVINPKIKVHKLKKIQEMVYDGNIGALEMFKFFQVASEKEIKEMEEIAKKEDWEAYKKLIKKVLKVNLK